MNPLVKLLPLCAFLLAAPACQVAVTDASNTPSGPYVQANRTVFQLPTEAFDRCVPAHADKPIPGSPFSVQAVSPNVLAQLNGALAAPPASQAQLPIGWPGESDLWNFGGDSNGTVRIGARRLPDNSLHLHVDGTADAHLGSPTALHGALRYDGPCAQQQLLLFTAPEQDASHVYVIAYLVTALPGTQKPSPTLSLQTQ